MPERLPTLLSAVLLATLLSDRERSFPTRFSPSPESVPDHRRRADGHLLSDHRRRAGDLPLGVAFGIDPIHLGIIFLANLELGYLVPPVGENLFIAACRFDKPIGELARAVLPMVGVLLAGVLAITYIPGLSLWLVKL